MDLLLHLPNKYYKCDMDNLFVSPRFTKIAKHGIGKDIMIYGVCRPSRGIPNYILQTTVTKKKELLKNRGIVKASILVGDSICKGLVILYFYDSKPVYFISNAYENIK